MHLDCWSIKIFSHFGGFVHFDSDPLRLSFYGAFLHFCFSLSAHVIAWQECWLSTPVLCDHLIVHLDCWSIKIFSHFWGFCPLWFWSFGAFVLWCFCPFLLFSGQPRDRMMRMLICPHLYHVIIWFVDLDCWSIKIFSHFYGFCPLWFWSFGAFVLSCFCKFLLFSVRPRDRLTRMLIIHTYITWSWHRAPWLLEY